MLVHDLHRVDSASLAVLHYLVRELADRPVLRCSIGSRPRSCCAWWPVGRAGVPLFVNEFVGALGCVPRTWPRSTTCVGPVWSTMDVRSVVAQGCSELVEPLCAQLAPVRELVVSIPTPCRGDRQREDPALAKQVWVSRWTVFADVFGRMGDVELDGSAAARLQVDEQGPCGCAEDVAGMRLTMQQLLIGTALADRAAQARQGVAEQFASRLVKLWGVGGGVEQSLRLRDSVGEVWRGNVDLPHAGMQPAERSCVLSRREVGCWRGLVVPPERDGEAVTYVHAGLDPGLEPGHRAVGFGESSSDLHFELGTCLMRDERDPGKDVTWHQAHSDPIGVVQDNRVIGPETEHGGRGHGRGHRTRDV